MYTWHYLVCPGISNIPLVCGVWWNVSIFATLKQIWVVNNDEIQISTIYYVIVTSYVLRLNLVLYRNCKILPKLKVAYVLIWDIN